MELGQTRKGNFAAVMLLFVTALAGLLAACFVEAADNSEARLLFRMTGSNTVGADLAPALVKQYLRSLGATDINQRTQGEKHWIDARLQNERVVVPIIALGSSTGFKALNGDTADIGMASRRVKTKEVEMLARFGDFTGPQAEHVIGLDALVIAVHKDNPIKRLSLAQLAQIYRGEIRNWAQLGGDDLPIRPLHRDIESGTRATFDSEVFGGSRPAKTFVYEVSGNHETRGLVLRDRAAIGYLPFADATGLHKVAIKSGELAAVVPDRGIIATEDFPLTRRLYLYRNPGRYNPQVDAFMHFAESHAGQQIVEDIGFINLTPVALQMAPFANAPENYRALMESGSRLSISFRFANGSTELDNRALRDLHRLQDYMAQEENRDLSLTLVGFSDRKSNETISDLISRFRALKVQGALLRDHQMGDSQIMSVGAFAPLTADSKQGPVKNSRVEVWIN
ncbi:phosphate ABC transporter substrate-binding protein [Microbulbifer agarilyticus]|uniref:substrate-binding domain-containing protein n=1 Tax=Microbulbifer agarilyticus TaxID=260552 RepID=UPI001C985DE5|nr:substrate-binding domain-containing protein [Microbulbifer agarilyticus]MBY6190537.1 phosphate ABC transporter substrate-binding protein [Microbulbifer agarilyticus]